VIHCGLTSKKSYEVAKGLVSKAKGRFAYGECLNTINWEFKERFKTCMFHNH